MTRYKPVIIEWIDAQCITLNGCTDINQIKELQGIPCRIIGFMLDENKDRIILSTEIWEDENTAKYIHVIPKVSIINIIPLCKQTTE